MSAGVALLAVIAVPVSARAASNILVEWTQQQADPYMLKLDVNDSNGVQLSNLVLHVYSGATDVYDITDMTYTSGPTGQQFWTTAAPIPQAAVPPGNYTLTADATDADETDLGLTAYGMSITYTTTLTQSAAPSVLSYGETGTTISGTLTGVIAGSPYANAPVPIAGAAISVSNGPLTLPVGTTQSDGSYSGSVQLPSASDIYNVAAAGGSTWQGALTTLSTSLKMDATRLVAVKITPQDFTYGGTTPATITGTAEYDDAITGWQPLQNHPVGLELNGANTPTTVMTNGSGQFTWQSVPTNESPWWVGVGDGMVLAYGSATGPVPIAVPVRFSSFAYSLSPAAQLTVHGCVRSAVPGFRISGGPLQIQYSAGPSGPWITLGHLVRQRSQGCSINGQSYYNGSLPVVRAHAYYRSYVAATPYNKAAASSPVLLWKYVTRIINLHVSARTVRKGGKLTVSGRLQDYTGSWQNLPRQQVQIVLEPKGSKSWYWIVIVRTTSSGYFTGTFKDPVSASWSAYYTGDGTHFVSGGAVYYVTVSG
jgi:hypothetical protein